MQITDPEMIQHILAALADERSLTILSNMSYKAISAMDLIREESLPVSSTYRKISKLEEEGLIGIERTVVMEDGKTYNLFKSTFVDFTIKFEHGNLSIDATPNQDILDKAFNLFYSFRRRKK